MWASFEMLDTFYGFMALLYHFVRDSLQLHNPYFISSQMKMTIVLPVFTGIYSIFKELFACFCNFYKYYIERGFFRQKKIDDFSQKMTHNYLVLKMKSLSYHSPSAFFKVPKFV